MPHRPFKHDPKVSAPYLSWSGSEVLDRLPLFKANGLAPGTVLMTRSTLPFLFFFLSLPAWAQERVPAVVEEVTMDEGMAAWMREHRLNIHRAHDREVYKAVNDAHDLRSTIDAHGILVEGPANSPAWGTFLSMVAYGRDDTGLKGWEAWSPCHGGAELVWTGRDLDIQYLHGEDGMRQNFLVEQRMAGDDPFQLVLHWESDLIGEADGGSGMVFKDAFGEVRHAYQDLKVWDACGKVLDSWMEVDPCDQLVTLVVDDRLATYPVTIDPILATFNLQINAPAGLTLAEFGYSMCSAGDLNGDGYGDIVVGAPFASLGENMEGAAYVYYGSANGVINTPTVLESNRVDTRLGISVAHAGDINGDGYSDLIVGANTYTNVQANEGAVYVYYGSPTGVSTVPDRILESNTGGAYMGFKVSGAGDLNGDGYSDIVAGASLYSANAGAVYVFLGSPTGFPGTGPMNAFTYRLIPNQAAARFGSAVSGAGDINGDGFDDIVVGAYGYDLHCPSCNDGAIMIYYGGNGGVGSTTPFGAGLNPAWGQIFNTIPTIGNKHVGWAVAGAGDVNGDGYSDIIIGDYRDDIGGPFEEGSAFVFHGSAAGINTTPATVLQINQINSWFGFSVSTAGDVNGDGYADVLVGAVKLVVSGSPVGASYLFLGGPAGVNSTPLIQYNGQSNACRMGHHVGCAGDVNGDGFSDFLMSMPMHNGGLGNNALLRIVHGGGYFLQLTNTFPAQPPRVDWSADAGAHLGWSVANAGDVNGDGFSDAVVGAPDAEGNGVAHVYYGSATGLSTTPDVTLSGPVAGGRFGASVATAGDVNGDGYADVVVGAPDAAGTGRAYIYMGGPAGLSAAPALTLNGTPGSQYGGVVSTAGDVNNDGHADVLIGIPGSESVHLHMGTPAGLQPIPDVVLASPQPGSLYGSALATAGDVNGDGYSDIIIGAPNYSNGQAGEGGIWVHHGSEFGLDPMPAAARELNQAGARFGVSVAGAGDVNGDGFFDVVIGADGWNSNNGRVVVYHGSAAGIGAAVATSILPNIPNARFGLSVAEAGDIDGNGYADIIVGAPYFSSGQAEEGRIYTYGGSVTGIFVAQLWSIHESNVVGRRLGLSVAGGGDVNGDGFSDLLAGAPYGTNTLAEEGAVYFYPGNAYKGVSRLARQYLADLVNPLSTNSQDFTNTDFFGLGFVARSHMQRKPGRLIWEVVHEGQPYSGVPITNSMGFTGQLPGYTDLGLNGTELTTVIYKVPGFRRYKWRVRVEYPIHRSAIDGQRFSKWHYGYASGHGDIGILPVELVYLQGEAMSSGNLIEWATASESNSDHFVVERGHDLDHFTDVGMVAAAGYSMSLLQYDLLDKDAPDGVSYYRLRMVDLDGSFSHSHTVAIQRNGDNQTLIFPNPVEEVLIWTTQGFTATRARVHDALGRLLIDAPAGPGVITGGPLKQLSAGSYVLVLVDAQGMPLSRSRFLKQ